MASLTAASLSFSRASSKLSPQSTSMPLAGRTAGPSLVRLLGWTNGSRNSRITCAAKAETVEKVLEIVKKQLALPADKEVTGKTTFTELGADSLDTVEIVMGLEEEFDISVEEESSQNISTVQEAADLIDKLLEKKPPA